MILLLSIICGVAFITFTSFWYKKRQKSVSSIEIPEGVITPVEALQLDNKQVKNLKDELAEMNKRLIHEIDGNKRSYIHKFETINDDLPMESLYEIQRLYTQAGWIVKLKHKSKTDYYYGGKPEWWEMTFKLPSTIEVPSQITKVRVTAEPDPDPSLEELGIDTLDQRFKKLEKNKK